jgi:hypothetical protein
MAGGFSCVIILYSDFFAHAEYESMSVEYPQYDDNLNVVMRREWVPGLLVGGGIFNSFGSRGGLNLACCTILHTIIFVLHMVAL